MAVALRHRLAGEVLLFDGAMGTMLASCCQTLDRTERPKLFEQLNLTSPELVQEVHVAYLEAGADVIETNTFRANRMALQAAGLSVSVTEINNHAVAIARKAIDTISPKFPRYVAGSIGPVLSSETADGSQDVDIYCEQAEALITAGADCIILETLTSARQANDGLAGIREAMDTTGSDIPVIVSFAPVDTFSSLTAPRWRHLICELLARGADFVGFNCGAGFTGFGTLAERAAASAGIRLLVMPSAGLPSRPLESSAYPIGPSQFAAEMSLLLDRVPVFAVGGCCGTTPEYVRVLRIVLDGKYPRSTAW